MNPRGGTEILLEKFGKWVNPQLRSRVNLIVSNTNADLLHPDMPNVLWQHLDTDQANVQGLSNPEYVGALDRIVFVSNWQMEKYINQFHLPRSRCCVILNAIESIPFVQRSRGQKLKLVYTSTPWRGLEVLVHSFRKLGRRDCELDVYSSTVIYGTDFMKHRYDWLFHICRNTPGVNYRGYVANKAVIKACTSANLYTYPSVFAETSCLSAIEAGAAGCRIVTTRFGALPETCGDWSAYTDVTPNLVADYTALLNREIDNYWDNYRDLAEQSNWFNHRYSWQNRAQEWNDLLGSL